MSTKIIQQFRNGMVRGAGGEPAIRSVAVLDDGSMIIQAIGSDPDDFIGWHPEDAFELDKGQYKRLDLLYRAGDRAGLLVAWAEQRPFNPIQTETAEQP